MDLAVPKATATLSYKHREFLCTRRFGFSVKLGSPDNMMIVYSCYIFISPYGVHRDSD